ncbi:MAG TPA: hypothetical protein VH877_25410 [Polyangia bacterium]|jgi:hypothetical protein|nr:hypothetical protein [Polyangia bacterium]
MMPTELSPSIGTQTPRAAAAARALDALIEAIERELGAGRTAAPPLRALLESLLEHTTAPLPPAQAPPELRATLDTLEDLLDGLMRAGSR